jgi:hypothetical protein
MSDETEAQPVEIEAPETEVADAPLVAEAPKTEPERPWKRLPPAEKPDNRIPYERFHEVNLKANTYKAQVEERDARIHAYEEREAKLSAIKSPDDIKMGDYTDADLYLRDRDKANAAAVLRQFEDAQAQKERDRLVGQHQAQLVQTYEKNLGEAFKRNPEIKEASDFIDRLASEHNLKPHPDIAYELMIDENLGELLFDIATNQELLTEMYRGNPNDFIRKLHKMSARIDREARYATKAPVADGGDPVVALDVQKKAIGAAIPTQVSGGSATVRKDPGKMSNAEYRVWRAKINK